MDEIQAAILKIKLRYFKKEFKKRQIIANLYLKNINNKFVKLPKIPKNSIHAFHLFVLKVLKRDKFRLFLQNQVICTLIHYPLPIHLQKAYKNRFNSYSSFKNTEKIMHNIVSIPIYPNLSLREVKYIIKILNSFE